ncbi:hypothetical protein B0H34DRAFT_493928 [Crassisporium funariophilum]|nr:hypothetical protein B0H34DRAFT_493928 [Crassisporium funariophilum]
MKWLPSWTTSWASIVLALVLLKTEARYKIHDTKHQGCGRFAHHEPHSLMVGKWLAGRRLSRVHMHTSSEAKRVGVRRGAKFEAGNTYHRCKGNRLRKVPYS